MVMGRVSDDIYAVCVCGQVKMGGKLLDAIKTKNAKRVLGALKMGAPANTLAGEVRRRVCYVMSVCLSVCLSVCRCVCVCGRGVMKRSPDIRIAVW